MSETRTISEIVREINPDVGLYTMCIEELGVIILSSQIIKKITIELESPLPHSTQISGTYRRRKDPAAAGGEPR